MLPIPLETKLISICGQTKRQQFHIRKNDLDLQMILVEMIAATILFLTASINYHYKKVVLTV
jgi:hypothetical protein